MCAYEPLIRQVIISLQKRQKYSKLPLFIRVAALLLLSVLSPLVNAQAQTSITSLQQITNPAGSYIITDNINAAGFDTPIDDFTGTLTSAPKQDGTFPVISNLTVPIFTTATDATISNIILDAVNISYPSSVGAICCTANGATRIYNCGILSGEIRSTGGATDNPKTANCCGSLVGLLDGTARVINCYSFANITGGNRVAGIVGYNNFATTAANIKTMVMNCVFYGDITGGNKVSPVYGGNNINNLNSGGLNTFNYYAYDRLKTKAITEGMYNCALAVEERYLTRFEFYRLMLNSNRSLAAYYASTSGNTVSADDMAKWVIETADKSIIDPKPYPILRKKGKYPSIINYDVDNAPSSSSTERNKGKKLGTLTVNINLGSGYPTGATLTTSQLTLDRTDKDYDRFNFNYDKVQLPYYNDVGTNNYTGNKVVTGWKITAITAVTDDPYTSANYPTTGVKDFPDHNYADRKSSNKDLYSVSKRVFSQGAYFDVPYGVESITIEPYWGKAAYVSDQYRDVVYNANYGSQNVSQLGKAFGDNGTSVQINGNSQKVYTSIGNALNNLSGVTNPTVYDYAVVLVGNLHHSGSVPSGGDKPFTIMSIDLDNDNEPDCSFIYNHNSRAAVSPIRFDFINVIGTAQAQKPNGADNICNTAIFRTKGWFEITNTALMYFSQFEYENTDGVTKAESPLILQGGVFDQFTSTQRTAVNGKTIYIHVGSNVWIKNFGPGTHSDGNTSTPHVPVSVTGGDYEGFYLTGTYNANAAARTDNAECYISGGRFGEAAGASMEQINGNVRWQIYDADITEFFGGGINDDKPITGTITTEIFNSHVGLFCGGPKFGNMTAGKDVTTTAQGCTFGKFFGAGYGGNSFSRKKYVDETSYNWNTYQGFYTTDKGKYFNGTSTLTASGKTYGYKGPGVAVDFDYEFFVWTSGKTGARFFVKFVTFSLAQCDNVESSLTDCTINGDFYGGGSLGKVTGTAKSTLDGCTVNGNVFGGGYSATKPMVPVRKSGFTQVPNYNKNSGMFEPGVLSGIDYYEWKHVDNYPNNGSAQGFVTENGKNYVITTANLEALGQVANTDLTVTGNTKVAGSVFGGGDQSETLGNTDVKVQTVDDNPNYTIGYVFGGGNVANVGGNVKVTMTSGTVLNDVYGGGAKANTNIGNNNNPKPNPLAETIVDLNGGLVQGDVYGGGLGNADTAALVWGDATVTLNGTKLLSTGRVFGGNNINGTPKGHIKVDIKKTVSNGQSIDLDAVFGGGSMAAYQPSDPDDYAEVLIEKANAQDRLVFGSVYGGGNEADVVAGTSVTLLSGDVISGIYGGCNTQGTVNGPIQVDIYGNVGTSAQNVDVFGGGFGPATGTNGNITVNIGNLTGYAPIVYGDIYGGSALGSVNDDAQDYTTVNVLSGQIHGNVFGGGLGESGQENVAKGQVNGTVIVNIGTTDGQQTPTYTGNATLYGSVYGCNNTNGSPQGNVTVNIYSTAHTTTDAVGYTADDGTNGAPTYAITDVFGGGRQADYTPSSDQSRATVYIHGCSNTIEDLFGGGDAAAAYGVVTIVDGGRFHRIFGGGNGEHVPADIGAGGTDLQVHGGDINQLFGGSNTNGVITGPMNTTVDSDGPCGQVDITEFFCGNNLASIGTAENPTSIVATIGCGTNFGDVYGGCNLADIYGDITLNIEGGSIVRVFGGSKGGSTAANIYGNVTLNITGGDIDNAFGGSNINGNISGSIQVNVNKSANPCIWDIGNIYGASNDATYTPTADGNSLTVNIMNGIIGGSVYGGGKGATAIVTSNPVVTIGDDNADHLVTITGNVYGGGDAAAVSGNTTVIYNDNNAGSTVPKLFGGGNAANVSGTTNVTLTSGKVTQGVYGGCNSTGSVGAVTVALNGGTIGDANARADVYGGGYGSATTTTSDIVVTLNGTTVYGDIYGGSALGSVNSESANPLNTTTINLQSATLHGSAFGGGMGDNNTTPNPTTAISNGNAVVNINAFNSYLTGVYGGANVNGLVKGNIEVNINANVGTDQDGLDIFGGGLGENTGTTGNVTVTMGSLSGDPAPIVYGNIYGGSALGSVNDEGSDLTTVNIYSGTITGNIYGGGLGEAGQANAAKGQVNGAVIVNIGSTDGAQVPTYSGFATIIGSVYGCNNTNGSPQDNVTVNIYRTGHTEKNAASYTQADATYAIDQVFGGGNQADYSPADGKKATVHIFTCDNTIRRLFGGGNAAAASGVVTIIDGGRIGYVFGGGNGEVTAANIGTGGTNLQIHGGNITQLFGGSNKNGIIQGTMGVNIDNDGDCGQDMFIAEFFCGNNEAPLNTDIEATIGCGTHFGDVYGGCNLADMTGNIILNIEGGRMANVYGGSKGSDGDAADITGSVTLNIKGGYIEQNAFGGSNVNGNITGAITVNVDWMQSSCADGQFLGNVYGGSNLATYTPTTAGNYPAVNIKNGTVSGNVYGGGKGATAVVTSNPNVTVGDATQGYTAVVTGDVYGGGDAAEVLGTPVVRVINKASTSIGNVYGGGNAADVSATSVTIDGGTITGAVYGGGHGDKESLNQGQDQSHTDKVANVNGDVSVTVTGGTIYRVFGGANTNGSITGDMSINVDKGTNSGELHITELYGGGNLAAGKAGTISIGCTGSATEGITDVYGGANQADIGTAQNPSNINLTITGGSIQRVFGGNNTSGTINGTIAVTVDWDTQNQCGYNYLGSVFGGGNHADYAGTPTVTIANGTVNDVYGGGNEANVAATIVNMNGGTVLEGLYGGCNTSGNVLGDVLVNINGGTMGTDAQHTANIHGGGFGSATGTTGNIDVTVGTAVGALTYPTIYGDVYGGSALGKVNGTTLDTELHTNVTLNAGVIYGSLYGGALGDANIAANVYAPVHVTVNGGTVTGGVYGCNNVNGAPQGTVTVDINGTDQPATGYALTHVFGGGNQAAYNGTPVVTLHNNQNMIEYVYGGGNQATVTGTNVTVYGGSRLGYVFGGGYGASVTQDGTNVNIYGGIINKVFGGNDQSGTVTGNISVTIDKQTEAGHESCLMRIDEVYGGGNVAASQAGSLTIRSTGGDTEGINYVFGGANDANVTGDITLNITGGRITNLFGGNNTGHTVTGNIAINVDWNDSNGSNDSKYLYNVYGGGQKADVSGNTVINIEKGTITNDVYGGGMEGHISDSVTVNIGKSDGTGAVTIGHDVYGGGALANTNTGNLNNDSTITTNRYVTNINLYPGATITHDVYGGGLGRKASQGVDSVQAIVYGDVTVTQFGAALTAVYDDDELATSGRIFGCNNINGTPKGHVLVNVKKTAQGSNPNYDLAAVYGGGNEAEYWPYHDETEFAEVLISPDNCDDISIHSVYGGGNAASTPATKVTINGAHEIKYVFGGGNGAGDDNPGANVGYHDYSKSQYTGTSESDIANRKEQFAYGTGIASTNVLGGHILNLYGGSNTKGNIRQSSIAMLDELSSCQLTIDRIHGGGREAYMEGQAILDLGCITGMPAIYGGSENADVGSNVELTISSGHYDKVFGGNNKGGRIFGSITVNIEQTGCLPVTIGELYLGGNNAPYSVYGYGDPLPEQVNVGTAQKPEYVTHYDLKHKDSPQGQLFDNPILHIRSFDSIGTVFGGGNGALATMIADPIVEINVTKGWVDGLYSGSLEKYSAYKNTPTELADYGQINTVFGGGNLALVEGNTTILIGDSLDLSVKLKSMDKLYNSIPSNGIKRGNIKEEKSLNNGVKTITYTVVDQDGNPVEGKEPLTITIEQTIYGAIITGNVYGGGNNADVTGTTHIQVGPE